MIIELENVSKTYSTNKKHVVKAIDNASLQIKSGEIFGIIGQSGAGKSTLIRLLNQLEKPTSGKIKVLGHNVGNLSEKDLKNLCSEVGMIFQHFNLFNSKNIFKNIEYPLKLNKIPKQQRIERVNTLLEYVSLSKKSKAFPKQLSGGQQQRVGIARALATNPKILLADEATSSLDPETTLEVLKLLKKVNQELGITVIIITHTMSIVKLICDRVAVMEKGKIVEINDVKSIFNEPKHPTSIKFINTYKTLESGIL